MVAMNRGSNNLAMALILLSSTAWAASGATLYKSKCARCHGHTGEGKPATKAPALKGPQLDESQIVDQITKRTSGSKAGGIHKKPIAGLNEDQAKSIAEYIKSLK